MGLWVPKPPARLPYRERGTERYELTLEIPCTGVTTQDPAARGQENLASGRMTPCWGRGQALPPAAGTQWQQRSLLGPLSPRRARAQGAE